MTRLSSRFLATLACLCAATFCSNIAAADNTVARIGIVIMHGKGGAPTKHVAELAAALQGKGLLVANLDMPWSGQRGYDVDVATADREVESALAELRGRGARKLFVAGHSQGGVFAVHYAAGHRIDGLIAIAPGGDVSGQVFREKLDVTLEKARKLVAEGKGEDRSQLADFEGSKGIYPVLARPATWLTWFDPDGAMNLGRSIRQLSADLPVLYIAPTDDYPALRKFKQQNFDALPKNPLTRLYEPEASHIGAPTASIAQIVEWVRSVANH